MLLDVSAVQDALRAEGLDGWLWFDFQGSNPIAQRLAGLAGAIRSSAPSSEVSCSSALRLKRMTSFGPRRNGKQRLK